MKLTSFHPVAQALRAAAVVLGVVALGSCGGRGAEPIAPPADPEVTVRSFLSAVSANSLVGMGQLFGGAGGPAAERMDRAELEQRLTVIKIYLEHEEYSIVQGDPVSATDLRPGERVVFVRLARRGCTPIVPFTLSPYRGGWLVRQIDLAAAGNPARWCGEQPPQAHREDAGAIR